MKDEVQVNAACQVLEMQKILSVYDDDDDDDDVVPI